MNDVEIAEEIRTALFMAVTVNQTYADDMLRDLADRLEGGDAHDLRQPRPEVSE